MLLFVLFYSALRQLSEISVLYFFFFRFNSIMEFFYYLFIYFLQFNMKFS